METFSALLALCAGNSPVLVNSPHKGQWRGALMFSLICARINDWVNNREAGDLRRYRGHYDVIVMIRVCIHKRHPISRLHGKAMRCRVCIFWRKFLVHKIKGSLHEFRTRTYSVMNCTCNKTIQVKLFCHRERNTCLHLQYCEISWNWNLKEYFKSKYGQIGFCMKNTLIIISRFIASVDCCYTCIP